MSSSSQGDFTKLSRAWVGRYIEDTTTTVSGSRDVISSAVRRAMPLLDDPRAVPFVCRYRQDVIQPLTTKMVHQLAEDLQTHKALKGLRDRILEKLPTNETEIRNRVETSLYKSELDDLYAPFKPPSKGSLEDRIRNENPELVTAIDNLWNSGCTKGKFHPHESAVTLLANRIAANPETIDECMQFTRTFSSIMVKKSSTKDDVTDDTNNHNSDNNNKFDTYYGFEGRLSRLRQHQILAIRRGVDKKALQLSFDVDNDRAEGKIRKCLGNRVTSTKNKKIWYDAIHNAWSRLLRKRCTSRAWKEMCTIADDRAIEVFCNNLQKALLAPPASPAGPILGLDPGFRHGIKAALLDKNGQLMHGSDALRTIHFVDNKEAGKATLIELLSKCRGDGSTGKEVRVALGNGHGTQEAKLLLIDASEESGIPVDIHLVNEAGASVWSVTEGAKAEFPRESSASIASVSIARRFQNPLAELIKIPPRSLGLGMYQHDFPEKILAKKLDIASIEAVALVGVDANSCSLEILKNVPGLTATIANKIIMARPLKRRRDLLDIEGLGPKTFENCAGFIRVQGAESDPIDRTLVHPESYDIARFLLNTLQWDLDDAESVGEVPPQSEWIEKWSTVIAKGTERFDVTEARILMVIDHLLTSITNPDPRRRHQDALQRQPSTDVGDPSGCNGLPPNLMNLKELGKACPVRKIVGQVRNIVDFGVFVDFGGENDGLVHKSKMGRVNHDSLLVGQEIGVDIIEVSGSRVSLALTGMDLNGNAARATVDNNRKRPAAKHAPTRHASKKKKRANP